MNLKKIGKVRTSKYVGLSSYEKRIYRAAVSQRLRNTGIGSQNRLSKGSRVKKFLSRAKENIRQFADNLRKEKTLCIYFVHPW